MWTNDSRVALQRALQPIMRGSPPFEVVSSFESLPLPQDQSIILAMGKASLERLQKDKLVPKNRTITSLRGAAYPIFGQTHQFILTYNPGIAEIDYGKYIDMVCDAKLAMRMARTGNYAPAVGAYEWVTELGPFLERVDALYAQTGKPITVAFDTETTGLNPYGSDKYIVCMQFCCEPGKAYAIHFASQAEEEAWFHDFDRLLEISEVLNSPKISLRAANGKYDLLWMYVRGRQTCSNFKFDTTAVGSLLDENRSNSLNVHAKIYTDMGGYDDPFNRTVDKGHMEKLPQSDGFLTYAAGDGDACLQVAEAQKQELLQDKQLTGFYINILHPALRAFEHIEQGGVLVDIEAYNQLQSTLEVDMARVVGEAKKILGGRLCIKHENDDVVGGLNLSKPTLIHDFMFSPSGLNLKPKMMTAGGKDGEGDKKPSTAGEHIEMFKDHPKAGEFVKLFKEYSDLSKTYGTYVVGFRKHLRSDGRFHPTYWLFAGDKVGGEGGTNTGRLSCKDPAFQTIPKHTKWAKHIRRCFIAPDGYLVLENDYSQGELRLMACIANEPTMIAAYRNGMDLHSVTSGRFAGYTYEEMMAMKASLDPEVVHQFEEIRQLGKAGNFGLIYGMQAPGFRDYAESNYHVHITMQEAMEFRDGFFNTYSELPKYHAQYQMFAHKFGFVRNPLGRIRHLPLINSRNYEVSSKAERQAINAPVQGALSDLMIWSIGLAHSRGYTKVCPIFGNCHDAGYTYIPEDNASFYAKRQRELMENLPFEQVGWQPQLKFLADGKWGKSMGTLVPVVE